ncbi:putative nmra-like family protein [Phaeoacremonium minimum UCRPA7]|uniref:Putative nmra-like family protein n=1 Tax=Phaeoacremonium minimum (strain UCR-PA7) TaxID=1286976 RepID=R8BSZ2_PHAM7|nr:putative nmra-like family protein [Phaeoacremonium minimum UCRPA7]EOO02461.1 putative nmra-like family protein [Phaeoacremonium minimum UCRPA7]
MPVVAVAGGTGGLGRALVDAIIATGKYEVKILSRQSNPALEAELDVTVLAVDYSNINAVTKTLEQHNVHTVISALSLLPFNGPPKEVELIRAADASKTTKRFIPSDWGFHPDSYVKEDEGRIPFVAYKRLSQAELAKTVDLEHTSFVNGFILDYWGMPHIKTYMSPMTDVVDIKHNVAAIPGSGDMPIIFTLTADIAKFAAASLSLEKWDPISYIIGDRVTWNEFVRLAEAAKGTKFKVTYENLELLEQGKVTELPSHVPMYQFVPKEMLQMILSTFGLWTAKGAFDFKADKTLNEIFPDIKATTVETLLNLAWKQT